MYYNQRDYSGIPYPAPGYEDATVKTSGCGPCCASMIVEALAGESFPPGLSAPYAIKAGARISGGTSMKTLSQHISADKGIGCRTSNNVSELAAHLKSGGWGVVNVGGDRSSHIGLFSDGGHYVVARALAADGRIIVWDPNNYSGKYDKAGRRGKVEIIGDDIYASQENVALDAQSRNPGYYLFSRKEAPDMNENDKPSAWAEESWKKAVEKKILDGESPQSPLTREQLAVVLDRLGLLK